MRSPSILAQCLPGLLPQERRNGGVAVVPERDNVSSAAVEILPGKGKYCVSDIKSEISLSTYDGSLKSWESSFDLVNVLKNEVRDGLLNFRGKRVLELGSSYGLPGICACLKGASTVHFQDISAETLRITTIPNVLANLEKSPSRQCPKPEVRFYAGEWEELPSVLSVVQEEDFKIFPAMNLYEEDNISSRRSRKSSGSQAWERGADVVDSDDVGGYDVILVNEIPPSSGALKRIYALVKKCLRPPYGVIYLSTKKNFVGLNCGARQLRALVDKEGIFGVHLISEVSDGEVWKFFLK